MKKFLTIGMASALAILLSVFTLFANSSYAQTAAESAPSSNAKWAIYLAAGFCMGLATLGTGLAQGRATAAAVEGIARNPSASNRILTSMVIGLAMIESLAIYGLVVALVLLFVV